MSLTISSNSLADYTNGKLNNILSDLSSNVYKLSTGLRINTASDDPAGLALREKLRAELARINQGIDNLEDGISLIQTAESGLQEIDAKLIRMKELAEQASTSTYTASDRLTMQSEFELMAAEIDRIANASNFNDIQLLDGSVSATSYWNNESGWREPNSGVLIHFGGGSDRTSNYYYLSIADSRTSALFDTTNIAISTTAAAQTALDAVNTAILRKENNRAYVGALQSRLESSLNVLQSEYAAKDQAESNISDLDVASEITDYVKNLVLAQSNIAILGQANIIPQMALELLQNI